MGLHRPYIRADIRAEVERRAEKSRWQVWDAYQLAKRRRLDRSPTTPCKLFLWGVYD